MPEFVHTGDYKLRPKERLYHVVVSRSTVQDSLAGIYYDFGSKYESFQFRKKAVAGITRLRYYQKDLIEGDARTWQMERGWLFLGEVRLSVENLENGKGSKRNLARWAKIKENCELARQEAVRVVDSCKTLAKQANA